MKHVAPISGIACFEERYVATAGYDNQVILWNGDTKRPIHRVYHDHLANQCAFSSDGRFLVSASSDHTARIWEVPRMRLHAALLGHTDDVEMAAFNPGGGMVATCSRDHSIRLFSASTGACLHVLKGHTADVISVSWAADGLTLVSSSDDGTIRRWDAEKGSELQVIDLNGVETDTIALASDGTIFAGDDEGRLSIIGSNGSRRQIEAHAAGIKRVVWNDRQRWLVSLSYDRSVVLWRFTGSDLEKISTSSLPSIVWPRSCAFLSDEQVSFVTFGSTYAIWNHADETWDLSKIEAAVSLNAVAVVDGDTYAIGDAGILRINGKPAVEVGSLCNFLLPFGDYLLTGGQMGQVFDAKSGRCLHQHRSPLNCATYFERDGTPHAAIGSYTGEALVFQLEASGGIIHVGDVQMHDNAIKGLAANDEYVFSVCADTSAAFYRIHDQANQRMIEGAHDRIANACASIADGFVSVGRDLKLRIWRGDESEVHNTPHMHSIKCVAATRDGKIVATGSYGGLIALFCVKTGRWLLECKPTTSGISSIICSPHQDSFVASSYDGSIYTIAIP